MGRSGFRDSKGPQSTGTGSNRQHLVPTHTAEVAKTAAGNRGRSSRLQIAAASSVKPYQAAGDSFLAAMWNGQELAGSG